MSRIKIYNEYFADAFGFYGKLLTEAFKQFKEFGKVESKAYVLIPDKSGYSRVIVTSIKGGKEFEKKLSEEKRSFDVYYVRNVRGFVCVEHRQFLVGRIVEWQLELIKDGCSASVIKTKEGDVIVGDYPEGCFKKLNLSWSQLHA